MNKDRGLKSDESFKKLLKTVAQELLNYKNTFIS